MTRKQYTPIDFGDDLTEDEEENFEERAAIIEYDGGSPRKEAEILAYLLIKKQRRKL